MTGQSTPRAAREMAGSRLGLVSLGVFGLVALWGAGCSLWIKSLYPSEAALPVIAFLCFGVLTLSGVGMICGMVGLFLTRVQWWVSALGLLLNSSPWAYLLYLTAINGHWPL